MTSLGSLPNELLLEILSYLPRLRDIAAVASQCRGLRNLIDMPNRRRFYEIRLGRDGDVPGAWPLLWELLKRPGLGAYINIVDISLPYEQYPRSSCKHYAKPGGMAEEEQLLETCVIRAGFQGEKAYRMMEALLKGERVDADNQAYSQEQR
jgi:F-box-like